MRFDLSDDEWARLEPLMPKSRQSARADDRKIMNPIFTCLGALPVIPSRSNATKKAYCPKRFTDDATKSKTTSVGSKTGAASLRVTTNSPETSLPPQPSSVHLLDQVVSPDPRRTISGSMPRTRPLPVNR
jgi:hypothetical protein